MRCLLMQPQVIISPSNLVRLASVLYCCKLTGADYLFMARRRVETAPMRQFPSNKIVENCGLSTTVDIPYFSKHFSQHILHITYARVINSRSKKVNINFPRSFKPPRTIFASNGRHFLRGLQIEQLSSFV